MLGSTPMRHVFTVFVGPMYSHWVGATSALVATTVLPVTVLAVMP